MGYSENVREKAYSLSLRLQDFDSHKKREITIQIIYYVNEFLSRRYFINTLLARRQILIFVETRPREKQHKIQN